MACFITNCKLSKSCCWSTKSITGRCKRDFSFCSSALWGFSNSLLETTEVTSILGTSFCKAEDGLHKREVPPSVTHKKYNIQKQKNNYRASTLYLLSSLHYCYFFFSSLLFGLLVQSSKMEYHLFPSILIYEILNL